VNSGRTTLRWTFTPDPESPPTGWYFDDNGRDPRDFYFNQAGTMTWHTPGELADVNFRAGQSVPALLVVWFYDHAGGATPSRLIPLFRSPRTQEWHATIDSRADNRGDYFETEGMFNMPSHLRFAARD